MTEKSIRHRRRNRQGQAMIVVPKSPETPPKMFPLFGKHRATGCLVIYASGEDFARCGITRFGNSECSQLWQNLEPKAVWENAVYKLFHSPEAKAERAKHLGKVDPIEEGTPLIANFGFGITKMGWGLTMAGDKEIEQLLRDAFPFASHCFFNCTDGFAYPLVGSLLGLH